METTKRLFNGRIQVEINSEQLPSNSSLPPNPADSPDIKTGGIFLDMVKNDFENIFKLHLNYVKEKNTVSKLTFSIFAVPYFVGLALVTAKILKPADFIHIGSLPKVIYGLTFVCGIFGIILLLQFIELVGDQARCLRAINFLRSLYYSWFSRPNISWPINDLPIDQFHPSAFRPLSWSGLYVFIVSVVNAIYICFGIFKYRGLEINSMKCLVASLTILLFQYLYYFFVARRKHYPSSQK